MIKISNIKASADFKVEGLKAKAALMLGIAPDSITDFALSRLSVDARKKSDVHYVCTVTLSAENEEKLVAKAENKNVELFIPKQYIFPKAIALASLYNCPLCDKNAFSP